MTNSFQRQNFFRQLKVACLVLCWFPRYILADLQQCHKESGKCIFHCEDKSGEVDLSPLNQRGSPRFKNIPDAGGKPYTYAWNPCTIFTLNSECTDVNACQFSKTLKSHSLGSTILFYHNAESKQYIMKTVKGDDNRKFVVIMEYSAKDKFRTTTVTEGPKETYTMTLYTKYLPHKGSGGGSDDDGISVGTVLVIIFFSVLILYFGIGIAFLKYRRGAQGKDMIPNYEFWADLPKLIKAGCVFSAGKTKECVSSAREKTSKEGEKSGYEEIKE